MKDAFELLREVLQDAQGGIFKRGRLAVSAPMAHDKDHQVCMLSLAGKREGHCVATLHSGIIGQLLQHDFVRPDNQELLPVASMSMFGVETRKCTCTCSWFQTRS